MEAQQKKLKVDQRELETLKKRQKEQFEKTKEDEYKKIREQKKLLEQRQKNIQMATSSSKRDKEEIESLRKQLASLRDDLAQRDKYLKA